MADVNLTAMFNDPNATGGDNSQGQQLDPKILQNILQGIYGQQRPQYAASDPEKGRGYVYPGEANALQSGVSLDSLGQFEKMVSQLQGQQGPQGGVAASPVSPSPTAGSQFQLPDSYTQAPAPGQPVQRQDWLYNLAKMSNAIRNNREPLVTPFAAGTPTLQTTGRTASGAITTVQKLQNQSTAETNAKKAVDQAFTDAAKDSALDLTDPASDDVTNIINTINAEIDNSAGGNNGLTESGVDVNTLKDYVTKYAKELTTNYKLKQQAADDAQQNQPNMFQKMWSALTGNNQEPNTPTAPQIPL